MLNLGRFASIFLRPLGSCSVCTSRAFLCATGSLIASLFFGGPLKVGTEILTALLFALWVAHLLAHAIRAATANKQTPGVVDPQFRQMLFGAKAFLISAATSFIPSTAFAMGSCGSCNSFASDYHCWRDGYDGNCYKCRSCGNDCGDNVC